MIAGRSNTSRIVGGIGLYAAIAAYVIFALFPIFWTLKISVTPNQLLYSEGITLWPSSTTLQNFVTVLDASDFPRYFLNSVIVSVATAALVTVIATLAGYAMSRFTFRGKAVLAILLSTLAYFAFFRRELKGLAKQVPDIDGDGIADWTQRETPVPWYVTVTHLFFMAVTVLFAHDPPLFLGGFLFFLAFSKATRHHQNPVSLRGPILVGFFLAGLVVHGGLQSWWLQPILASLGEWPLFAGSTLLTSFNDNAAITFLASQVEGLSPAMKYAVLAGAITGGGLTVIANAPNPAGQTLLARFFGEGVSPLKLLLAALLPTLIAAACLMLLPR